MIISIDGINYAEKVFVIGVKQIAVIVDKGGGAETQSGKIHRKVTGVKYSYEVTFVRDPSLPNSEWLDFYNTVTEPVEFHDFSLPHDSSQLTFRGFIESVERELIDEDNEYIWDDVLVVTIVPEQPQRRKDT